MEKNSLVYCSTLINGTVVAYTIDKLILKSGEEVEVWMDALIPQIHPFRDPESGREAHQLVFFPFQAFTTRNHMLPVEDTMIVSTYVADEEGFIEARNNAVMKFSGMKAQKKGPAILKPSPEQRSRFGKKH